MEMHTLLGIWLVSKGYGVVALYLFGVDFVPVRLGKGDEIGSFTPVLEFGQLLKEVPFAMDNFWHKVFVGELVKVNFGGRRSHCGHALVLYHELCCLCNTEDWKRRGQQMANQHYCLRLQGWGYPWISYCFLHFGLVV